MINFIMFHFVVYLLEKEFSIHDTEKNSLLLVWQRRET